MSEYEKAFIEACRYSEKNGFDIDSESHPKSISRLQDLLSKMIDIPADKLITYSLDGLNPVKAFGSDCGNVHYFVTNWINKYYPDISANIVIGQINYKNRCLFEFNQEKYKRWQSGDKEKNFDCHAWINIGSNIILDLTIGTYLNTRCSLLKNQNIKHKKYGGIFYRSPLHELIIPLSGVNHRQPREINRLDYKPVLVGCEAVKCIAFV